MGQVELSGDYTDLEKVIKEFHISLGIFLFERLILPLLLFLLYINQIPDVYRSSNLRSTCTQFLTPS